MKVKLATTIGCLVTLSCLATNASSAEDLMDLSLDQLGDIPVSAIASGTSKPIFRSAAMISVVTAEQIKAMGATELHEILETVPGVHASLQDNNYDYSYTMRGISNAANSQVLMLLNGTRITTPFQSTLMPGLEMPIENIQRVEVIRGPGSALYGADAFAGVINIITKNAKYINGKVVGARIGDHSTQSGWGQYSTTLGGWDIASSLQYQHTQGDDGRIVKTDVQSSIDRILGTHASQAPGSLNTRFETLNGHLNLQRKHWDIGFWAFNSIDAGTRAGSGGSLEPNGVVNGEQYMGDVRFSTEDWLEDWELSAHASYLYNDLQAQLQLFPENAKLPIGPDGNFSLAPGYQIVSFPNGYNLNLGRAQKVPSIELSSVYTGLQNHSLRLSAGFRYEGIVTNDSRNYGPTIIDGSQPVVDGTLTNVTGTPLAYLADTKRTIWSIVAQDEWQFANDWLLTAGIRYDDYSDFGGTVNPRAALVWDINEQLTSKLLYGRAFRAPSFAEQGTQNNPVVLGNKSLDPETINTYEWAFDYRPISSLRTAVNIYYYQIHNLITQELNTSGSSLYQYQNSGNQNGFGSEFEWNWQLSEQWSVLGNYAWQHATNEDTNKRVPGVPEHHIYAALQWHFMPNWQIQPQINWIAGRERAADDTKPLLGDYETFDVTLRGKKLFGHLNITASLHNAFDTRYYEPVASLTEHYPMPGRSFYLEAALNF